MTAFPFSFTLDFDSLVIGMAIGSVVGYLLYRRWVESIEQGIQESLKYIQAVQTAKAKGMAVEAEEEQVYG